MSIFMGYGCNELREDLHNYCLDVMKRQRNVFESFRKRQKETGIKKMAFHMQNQNYTLALM